MKQLFRTFFSIILLAITLNVVAQSYTNLAGNWLVNGDASIPAQITQNVQYLTFSYANGTSSGYYYSANQLYAKEWNAYATLSADGNKITWDNQYWIRASTTHYPDLSGTWYVNSEASVPATITQNGQSLNFSYSAGSSEGSFNSTSQVYAKAWNAVGNIAADLKSITWSNQTWTRSTKTTTGNNGPKGSHRYCRFELSSFYSASGALGSAWGRSATEPPIPTVMAVAAISAHLSLVASTFAMYEDCLQYDLSKVRNLRARLSSLSSSQITQEIEIIIKELEIAVSRAPFTCDNGVNPISLYVGGVHLGAAQAWASAQQCRAAPMPAVVATVIRNHLTTAASALTPYSPCLQATMADGVTKILAFDFASIGMVPLASMNSIEAHTNIVGIHTQLLWAIALSDCCCTCKGSTGTGGGSACDASCQDYCKQKGYQNGRFNGKTPCLLGVVSGGLSEGCDCY
ncbi:MAG: hypothetical protein M3Q56_10985 [Bacteroidota bacterium]|nr:hypothetical protein [Bacteroidota bacterium]